MHSAVCSILHSQSRQRGAGQPTDAPFPALQLFRPAHGRFRKLETCFSGQGGYQFRRCREGIELPPQNLRSNDCLDGVTDLDIPPIRITDAYTVRVDFSESRAEVVAKRHHGSCNTRFPFNGRFSLPPERRGDVVHAGNDQVRLVDLVCALRHMGREAGQDSLWERLLIGSGTEARRWRDRRRGPLGSGRLPAQMRHRKHLPVVIAGPPLHTLAGIEIVGTPTPW